MFNKIFKTGIRNEAYLETFRFFVTGIISNTLGYFLFLVAIYILGIGHKIAITILFAVGMAINFSLNRTWTFKSRGSYTTALFKFLVVYLSGYGLNIFILSVFVDHMGYSPAWVQFFAIGFLAIYYFITNKYFIHRN